MSREKYEEALNRVIKDSAPYFLDYLDFYEQEPRIPPSHPRTAASRKEHAMLILEALRYICLLRSHSLYTGALSALGDDNPFAMVILIRAHVETTAVLGSACRKAILCNTGKMDETEADEKLFNLLFGTRDEALKIGGAPQMVNILTLIGDADKAFNMILPSEDQRSDFSHLRDTYDHLSEYAHPNFHSNFMVVNHDTDGSLRFEERASVRESEAELLNSLGSSAHAFIQFHNACRDHLV